MNTQLHLLDSFAARGSDGTVHKVLAYERRVADPNVLFPDQWESTGVAEYRLDSGEVVVVRGDGAMHTANSGILLERL